MINKNLFKITMLAALVYVDAAFIVHFLEGNDAEKIATIIFTLLTIWFALSLFKDKQSNRKKLQIEKENISQTINEIKKGNIPRIENCSLILKPGEFPCIEVQTYLEETKNKLVGSTGSSGGMSVKVAKGLYLRSGSGGSRKIYKDIIEKHFGNFIITNQRIVFMNTKKGFEIPYKNLTGVTSSGANLILQSKSKSYCLFTSTTTIYEELIRAVANKAADL